MIDDTVLLLAVQPNHAKTLGGKMKLKALIKKLGEQLERHGNLDVKFDDHWDGFNAPSIKLRKANFGDGYPKSVQKSGKCLEIKGKR